MTRARTIAGYRSRHDIFDERSPLGQQPIGAKRRVEWEQLSAEVDGVRAVVHRYRACPDEFSRWT